MLKLFFSRRYWWTTLLAAGAIAVMLGLAGWQFDRLQQRGAFNARVNAQLTAPPLMLGADTLDADLANMEYRAVVVVGEYDHSQEVAFRNQAYQDRLGIALVTPLVISGSRQAVLVNRGWIPYDDAAPAKWKKYSEPGIVQVRGVIRKSVVRPDFGSIDDPPGRNQVWNLANIQRIAEQISYPLLPVYIQQTPNGAVSILTDASAGLISVPDQALSTPMTVPMRLPAELDLSEGPHLYYALQWSLFASIVAIGYPRLVWTRNRAQNNPTKDVQKQ